MPIIDRVECWSDCAGRLLAQGFEPRKWDAIGLVAEDHGVEGRQREAGGQG